MSKHTPGPWTLYDARKDGSTSFYVNHGPDYIGSVHLAPGRAAVGSSNARLIAAAPELLEALQELVYGIERPTSGRFETAMPQARAAIAKATGEQP